MIVRKTFALFSFCIVLLGEVAASSGVSGMILRVRMSDGSMQRLEIPEGTQASMTLKEALSTIQSDDDEVSIRIGSSVVKEIDQPIAALGLSNGSLLTLAPVNKKSAKAASRTKQSAKKKNDRFDPFPDLAKDYQSTLLKTKTRRSSQGGMAFGSLADLTSSLHTVEPQPTGPLKRVYMCRNSAERFQSNCVNKKKTPPIQNRVGLLLGNIVKERVNARPKKTRTSLSSLPSDTEYCHVAKVHALWEPSQSANSKLFDASRLSLWSRDATVKRALELASMLGLRPVGWIFAYSDPRSHEDDALPVWGLDVETGAKLQIANMRENADEGHKFATLAMDANTGATEAFQLSDVSVQMVAEEMFVLEPGKNPRHVKTAHGIVVDGKETTTLDSVLCLVNTAMLSHTGAFCTSAANALKKSGGLTNKTKKQILDALAKSGKDDCSALFDVLGDFNVLFGLDQLVSSDDMTELCRLVRKWARGQKRGTILGQKLKVVLQSVLES